MTVRCYDGDNSLRSQNDGVAHHLCVYNSLTPSKGGPETGDNCRYRTNITHFIVDT